ncbi:MAG TPA: UDP-N-acetylmuramoyl-L-alanine--D-glutamate ligase [Candidatus Saccharimonas sp.]|nr:UDP-N-acetylmuramoyl-L-alanine--D-glutamate ligase [Candidatus Saccharimonas sp.]
MNQKIAILGYRSEGIAAYRYWKAKGADITICDQLETPAASLPEGVATQLGPDYLKDLDRFDVIVRSPGLNPSKILAVNPTVGPKITTIVNEFLAASPTRNLVGVTGTKGKGTTTTLIAKMLEATGKQVFVGGNIGTPVLDLLPQLTPDSWAVLELSSFQLYDVTNPTPHIAVCLMIAPEHLDWHGTMDDYLLGKSQLFAHQQAGDIAVYFAQNDYSKHIAAARPGTKIPYFAEPGAVVKDGSITIAGQTICRTDELGLLGEHNWQNACAAVTAVWQVAPDAEAIRSVLVSFTGLEHRLELVREVGGVKYYDDSFGTTPETAIVAIQAFAQPKVVILGGSDKGANFTALAGVVQTANVREVVLIGNMANPQHRSISPSIEAELKAAGYTAITSLVKPGGPTMAEAVAAARAAAQPGDVVLLSTGCASFDMFKDYKDRAAQFQAAVSRL